VGSYTNETIKGSLGSFCSLLLFFLFPKRKKTKKLKKKENSFSMNSMSEEPIRSKNLFF
jgi:hypothetical protein